MIYNSLKEKLLSLFATEKLSHNDHEWGFFNEKNSEINRIGFCVNLTPKAIEKAHNHGVDLLLTHHDAWPFVFGMADECQELLKSYRITHCFFSCPSR